MFRHLKNLKASIGKIGNATEKYLHSHLVLGGEIIELQFWGLSLYRISSRKTRSWRNLDSDVLWNTSLFGVWPLLIGQNMMAEIALSQGGSLATSVWARMAKPTKQAWVPQWASELAEISLTCRSSHGHVHTSGSCTPCRNLPTSSSNSHISTTTIYNYIKITGTALKTPLSRSAALN